MLGSPAGPGELVSTGLGNLERTRTMADERATLSPPSGMQREVGLLFAQLEEVRRRTRDEVLRMSSKDLDRRVAGYDHSIGVHLLHIAGAEYFWIYHVVEGRPIPDWVQKEYGPGDLDGEASRSHRGHHADFYLGKLHEVRAVTEALCWRLQDAALDDLRAAFGRDQSLRWILFHLAEHEAHHLGQVLLLKRLGRNLEGTPR